MVAFEAAVNLGFEYLETDIQATIDGHLVVFHDEYLSRMTGINRRVTEMTLDELQQIKVKGCEPIPQLIDLLKCFPETKINIDPKSDNAIIPLLTLLNDINVWDRVCVGSFVSHRIEFMRNEAGDRLCTAATSGEIKRLWFSRFGLPTGRIIANCAQVPPSYRLVQVVDGYFIKAAHAHNLPIHVWTINHTTEMKQLLAKGVDAIMSDEAEMTMNYFQRHVWRKWDR